MIACPNDVIQAGVIEEEDGSRETGVNEGEDGSQKKGKRKWVSVIEGKGKTTFVDSSKEAIFWLLPTNCRDRQWVKPLVKKASQIPCPQFSTPPLTDMKRKECLNNRRLLFLNVHGLFSLHLCR